MDLNTITEVERPRTRDEIKALTGAKATGDAWLAGGTWLFSEPQPRLRRLIDLAGLDWMPLQVTVHGLGIAATCTIATSRLSKRLLNGRQLA
jgi:CO/xanthine dehydrogenase FAD-binding subunit